MANPNDATIDIPLTTVPSRGQTGARKAEDNLPTSGYNRNLTSSETHSNEKAGLFHRHVAGRRRIKAKKAEGEATGREGYGGEEDTLTQMGKIYNKILNFSIITRYFVYVLPLALLIAVPIVVGATATQKAKLGGVRIVWIFTWVEIVWSSLWVSKVFAKFLPSVFQFLCGIVSSGTRKYALVLKSLEIPLSLAGWALASLATFVPLMTRNPDQHAASTKNPKAGDVQPWQLIVNRILAALLVASLIFLAEKLLVQLISISYHRKQFNAKIKESKHNVYLLSLLYDASRALFPAYCNEFAEEDYVINASIEIGAIKKASGHNRSGSATPLRLIQNVGRVGDKITSAFGNVAQEITGKQVFNPSAAHSVVVEALEKTKSSEALAKRLWLSHFVVGSSQMLYKDFQAVYKRPMTELCPHKASLVSSEIRTSSLMIVVLWTQNGRKSYSAPRSPTRVSSVKELFCPS
ncbi:MAG: hypothetical protein M1830_001528 [Pleopsidium flavum]|nr:MAG: hypothetical protein M1830_001528 [Pleopsidium flavum]